MFVTVYKVQLYDAHNDAPLTSRRMATATGAAMMGGSVIDGTGIEIEEGHLERGFQWTAIGFNPNPPTGFQGQVS